ncbi:hypothetical protein SB6411_03210 [Klebsiella spallanzanii]|uniref:OmpR/PhoB-type domain-containing protein n=1 Tax=Klebsiella spallanzanii TaxID=2587528 RepID=A0ABY6VIA7_9ENTR|nr:hypothetical protein [Klebsiella spallanzanii]VUS85434.1 hypothetical protein SB6411_03210 [Klebsiella spallanzanii]
MQNMRHHLLYGYNLNRSVEFRVTSGLLINIRDARVKKLSDTSARLLRVFIEGTQNGLVSDDDIARDVFESAGLKSSSSRIRGVIRDLKDAFRDLGFHPDFISRHIRQGYYVHFDKVEFLIALDNSMEWPHDSGFYTECDDCGGNQVVIRKL